LHNQSALRLKTTLHYTPGVMVASVPWQLSSSEGLDEREEAAVPGQARRGLVGQGAPRDGDVADREWRL
jgi:hypothetical protein